MTASEAKALEARDKQKVISPVEQTRTGITFTPPVDIFETDKDITVIAEMPGVKIDSLDVDLRDDVLTLAGKAKPPEGKNETPILQEYETGTYLRQFSLSDAIDQENIDAELADGVLRLVLPKKEKAVPRKIIVKAG